jgi:hypothetical protein
MLDNNNVLLKVFNSIVDVSKYYKENGITFHQSIFRRHINTNKEYNIPGVFWRSEETS